MRIFVFPAFSVLFLLIQQPCNMKIASRLLALCAILSLISISARAQRGIGSEKIIIDNGAGQTITIQTPLSGWTGNIPFVIPIPPPGSPNSGFSYPGTVANQILTWVMPNTTGPAPNNYAGGVQGSWQPTTLSGLNIVTGTGTSGRIPIWTGTNTQGNSSLTDNGTTLSYSGTTISGTNINAATGYQVAGAATSGNYLRGDGAHFVSSGIQAADVPTLNQNTTGTAANVTGTVAIANGGTGQTTQQAAINALTGTQSSGKYLRSDGSNATLSSLNGADLTSGSVTVGKISATGTPSSTTYLRGDGTWSTPSGSSGSGPKLVDNNSVTLGTILAFGWNGSVQVLTSSGYIVNILMEPDSSGNDFPIDQINWTGSSCTGNPYLNDGGETGTKEYYKILCYSGQSGSLYKLASPDTYGLSTSVAVTTPDIENPTCMTGGTNSGWALTSVTLTGVGLPSSIAYPLTVQ